MGIHFIGTSRTYLFLGIGGSTHFWEIMLLIFFLLFLVYCLQWKKKAASKADLSTFTRGQGLPYKDLQSEWMDSSVLLEKGIFKDGSLTGVPFKIASWKQDGKYVLKMAGQNEMFPWSDDRIKELARKKGTLFLSNAGWANLANRDTDWSVQNSVAEGRDGLLFSDGMNHFKASTVSDLGNQVSQVFEFTGKTGFETVSFGKMVENGKVSHTWEAGDPNEKNARNMLVLTKDGVVKVIQTYGHTSQKTGLNHAEAYSVLNHIGMKNIELAYALDGGGSTRMYTKDDKGQEDITGAKVDDRKGHHYIYLVERNNPTDSVRQVYANPEKVAQGVSKSITAEQYFAAKEAGQATVPGTPYTVDRLLEKE